MGHLLAMLGNYEKIRGPLRPILQYGVMDMSCQMSSFAFRTTSLEPQHCYHVGGGAASLEAQQRYFSYRAILVAIVSHNHFRACFHGVSHNYRAIRCKMGYRTDVPV